MSGIEGAFEKLKNALGDLSSLEVQTYTGDISAITPHDAAQSGAVNFEQYLASLPTSANLKLVRVTKMNFDGDAFNLVPETSPPQHVLDVHDAAVKAGLEVRAGLLDLFGKVFGIK